MPIGRDHRVKRCRVAGRQRRLPCSWWRERCHGIHQRLHLAVEQHLAITGLELLHVVLVAQVPVGQRELVRGANDVHVQVVATLLKPQLGHGGADIKQGQVIVAVIMVC